MAIKATAKFDKESIKALLYLGMYKKANPKKRIILWNSIYLLLCAVLIAEMIWIGVSTTMIVLLSVNVGVMVLMSVFHFVVPKMQYHALAKLKDVENEYTFGETTVKAVTHGAEFHGESEIAYTAFVKVYETSRYFFLYQTKKQVLIVDKTTVIGGTAEDIRNTLCTAVRDNYIVCNY